MVFLRRILRILRHLASIVSLLVTLAACASASQSSLDVSNEVQSSMGNKSHPNQKHQQTEPSLMAQNKQEQPASNQAAAQQHLTDRPNDNQSGAARPVEIAAVVIAAFALVAGIVAAVVYYYQLQEMRAANRLTKVSVDSVQRQLTLADRPWVLSDSFKVIQLMDQGKLTGWRIYPQWKNFGNRVAPAMEGRNGFRVFPKGARADFDFDLRQVEVPITLAPTQVAGGYSFFVSLAEAEALRQGMISLYVWGYATYGDLPDIPTHHTAYCYKMSVIPDANLVENTIPFAFDFAMGRLNHTD